MLLKRVRRAQLAVSLAELRDAVAEGWIIDPPVERQRIPDRPDGAWYCQIILWRDGRVHVLTVPDEPAVRQFLDERNVTSTDRK
jgi:hypothetical protein